MAYFQSKPNSGRHFLQIPGPSNVPDRILRAMSLPTIARVRQHVRQPEVADVPSAVAMAIRRAAVLVILLVLVGAACSGDDEPDGQYTEMMVRSPKSART